MKSTDRKRAEGSAHSSSNSESAGVTLKGIREAAGWTQVELASKLGKAQSEISKLERRQDFYVSTLREYIHALGGEIEVSVQLGGRTFRIRGL